MRSAEPAMRRSRGAAVVTALLIVMLATTVVTGLFVRENVTVRSVENRLALAQTRWIERAALDWAKVILRADNRAQDWLGEPWSVPVAETRLDETVTAGAKISDGSRSAMLAGQIVDAQSRLNVNGMVRDGKPVPEQVAAFRRLLGMLGLPESLAEATLERVTLSSERKSDDGKVVPPTQLPLIRLADLLTVPGFDVASVDMLAPFVIALPGPTLVNLNTAPAEVIAALIPDMDLTAGRRFVAQRERVSYVRNLTDASQLLEGNPTLSDSLFSVNSSYFIVRGVIRFDRVEAASDTLLVRTDNKVDIVWQQHY